MVQALLQSAVKMGERLRGRAETHPLAQVVPPLFAVVAVAAHDATLDCYPLADTKTRDF